MALLSTYIDRFKEVKTLVIGDIMLDRFMYGKVERISPEAPVPIFEFKQEKTMLGGAGNVSANLAALGCKVTYMGIIGNDQVGKNISKYLSNLHVHSYLLKLSDHSSIVKTRLIADNHHLLRVDQEEILPVVETLLPRFQRVLRTAIKNADIVILSDYNKGLLTPATTQMIIGLCQEYNRKVIVDPKGDRYEKYIGATLVKPNLKEFSEATGNKYDPTKADFRQKVALGASLLFKKYQIQNILVTLSEFGMIYVPSENPDDALQIATDAKEVFDVSGAGDTSLATLGAALGSGAPIKDAMKLANIASGIVVGKLGTAIVTGEELKNALVHNRYTEK